MQGFILWPFDLWQAGFMEIKTQRWSFRYWLFRLTALSFRKVFSSGKFDWWCSKLVLTTDDDCLVLASGLLPTTYDLRPTTYYYSTSYYPTVPIYSH